MPHATNPADAAIGLAIVAVILAVGCALYMLPTIVAFRRGHSNRLPLFLINALFGWIFLPWVLCMIWALSSNTDARFERLALRA